MGWTSGFYSRNEVLQQFLGDRQRPFRYCWVGNHLWLCYDKPISCIVLALVQRWGKNDWAYKDMDECSGPYYYTCPLSYLELVPDPQQGSSTRWREGVKAHHARKAQNRNRAHHAHHPPVLHPGILGVTP